MHLPAGLSLPGGRPRVAGPGSVLVLTPTLEATVIIAKMAAPPVSATE
ncbi:hypothetical protein [Nocardia nova]|nr:hypothetical protein [Nocardia nova]